MPARRLPQEQLRTRTFEVGRQAGAAHHGRKIAGSGRRPKQLDVAGRPSGSQAARATIRLKGPLRLKLWRAPGETESSAEEGPASESKASLSLPIPCHFMTNELTPAPAGQGSGSGSAGSLAAALSRPRRDARHHQLCRRDLFPRSRARQWLRRAMMHGLYGRSADRHRHATRHPLLRSPTPAPS